MKTYRQRRRVWIILAIVGLLPATWNACSQGPLGLSQESEAVLTIGGNSGSTSLSDLSAKSSQILATNCSSCHTATTGPSGIYDLTDTNHLISSSLIVVGQPDQSVIYQAISTGTMPPGGGLSASDIATIHDWIVALGQSSGGPTPTPAPGPSPTPGGPTPAPSSTPTPVSFANLQSTILNAKCTGCHSGATPAGNHDLTTYANVMTVVNVSNPANSALYTAVTTGGMPKNAAPLSSLDVNKILTWIQQGAPNN